MNEIIFLVEEDSEGGYIARALGYSIFIEANSRVELEKAAQEAIRCHFDDRKQSTHKIIFTK